MYFSLASLGIVIGAFLLATVIRIKENIDKDKEEYRKRNGVVFYNHDNSSTD